VRIDKYKLNGFASKVGRPRTEKTFWNGEPCEARKVRVIVGKAISPTWWCASLEGSEREAVEVRYGGQTFYLDNFNENGWWKVTQGKGSPQCGHSSLPDDCKVITSTKEVS
jgi:hypothetical protein